MGINIEQTGAYGMIPMVNLFILGSQKCGSSSLHRYIGHHHDIFAPKLKEPGLFREFKQMQRYSSRRFKRNFDSKEDYQKQLLDGHNKETYICDSSTFYTIGKISAIENTPKSISILSPNAKFIYIMRNPFDRLFSNYAHGIKMGDTTDNIDKFFEKKKFALETSKYYTQISRFMAEFPKKSFKLLSFNDMILEPKKTLESIYKFLNLPYSSTDFPNQFIAHNRTASLNKSKVKATFSKELYTKMSQSFENEIQGLKTLGFNVEWDLSADKWLTKDKPFTLYPSMGYLGYYRNKDKDSMIRFVKESKNLNVKVDAMMLLMWLLIDNDIKQTINVTNELINMSKDSHEFRINLKSHIFDKGTIGLKNLYTNNHIT